MSNLKAGVDDVRRWHAGRGACHQSNRFWQALPLFDHGTEL